MRSSIFKYITELNGFFSIIAYDSDVKTVGLRVSRHGLMAEYEEVLRRKKFPFKEEDIQIVTDGIRVRSVFLDPEKVEEIGGKPMASILGFRNQMDSEAGKEGF